MPWRPVLWGRVVVLTVACPPIKYGRVLHSGAAVRHGRREVPGRGAPPLGPPSACSGTWPSSCARPDGMPVIRRLRGAVRAFHRGARGRGRATTGGHESTDAVTRRRVAMQCSACSIGGAHRRLGAGRGAPPTCVPPQSAGTRGEWNGVTGSDFRCAVAALREASRFAPSSAARCLRGLPLRALSHRYRGVCILGRHATEGEPSR
jgi:hypothetical protein